MSERADDGEAWLRKLSPDEWIRAAMGEIARAEAALGRHDVRGAIAGCKRAAGMALNGALSVESREGWGRTYVEHLRGLAGDESAPRAVRDAASVVLGAPMTSAASGIAQLRTPSSDAKIVDAARDVIAHAYAVVRRHDERDE